jgi:hypothetical protein
VGDRTARVTLRATLVVGFCLVAGCSESRTAATDAPASPGRGTACVEAAACPDGLPCSIGMCGEPCHPATPCATGVCYVPGDVSGVCLDACACDVAGTCAAGTRCVDSLGTSTSACVADERATGATCTSGG